MSVFFPLILAVLAQSPATLTTRVVNLKEVYRKGSRDGVLTLEGGSLVMSGPQISGVARVIGYTEGRMHLLGVHGEPPRPFEDRQRGALFVTIGDEELMGDLNGDGDVLDLCAIAGDLERGTRMPPHAIQSDDPRNLVLGPDLVVMRTFGDGELDDYVALAWRPSDGSELVADHWTNNIHALDGLFAIEVGEAANQHDWTGDGDRTDSVYLAYDLAAGAVANTALAIASNGHIRESGSRVFAFAASEAASGVDLDGDGELVDTVLHSYALESGTTNLGLTGPVHSRLALDHWLAFARREGDFGDLNGDGDALDLVLHVLDGSTGVVQNVGLALGSAISSANFQALLGGTAVGFHVEEAYQGADLNGDGDASDRIAHVLDLATGAVTNLALVCTLEDRIALVWEHSSGDRNGDGDLDDSVPLLLGSSGAPGVNLGVSSYFAQASDDWVALLVSESGEGADLDGDGDQVDFVLYSFERASGTLSNLGWAVSDFHWAFGAHRVVFALAEPAGTDLNGDGDSADAVLQLVDLRSGSIQNLGLATTGDPILVSEELIAAVVSEPAQGVDLDGNGLIENVGVLHVVDRHRKVTRR